MKVLIVILIYSPYIQQQPAQLEVFLYLSFVSFQFYHNLYERDFFCNTFEIDIKFFQGRMTQYILKVLTENVCNVHIIMSTLRWSR